MSNAVASISKLIVKRNFRLSEAANRHLCETADLMGISESETIRRSLMTFKEFLASDQYQKPPSKLSDRSPARHKVQRA